MRQNDEEERNECMRRSGPIFQAKRIVAGIRHRKDHRARP
jgi:hypothetical protein